MNIAPFALAVLSTAIASAALECNAAAQNKRPLYDEVAIRVAQTKRPAVVTRSVLRIVDDEHYPSSAQLMWTERPGLSLLHLAGDQLSTIDALAAENLSVVRESMKRTTPRTKTSKVDVVGSSPDLLARGLAGVCFTAYRSQMTDKRVIAAVSGSEPVAYQTACELVAWAFAAQDIKLVPDPANPAAVILRPAD